MLELEKQNLRRNRLKSQTGTQVTLDDDFIVPDTMSDMAEVILDSGIIQLEPVKVQRERITVRESWIFMCFTGRKRAAAGPWRVNSL